VRSVALATTLREDIDAWLKQSPDCAPESWLFPSERLKTPMSKDNFMSRWMRPALSILKLEWVNFLVMRRTHASLMRDLGVDLKVVADSMGHDVGVNLNVYTSSSLESRLEAAETLGSALVH
jgi:integrase